MHDQDSRKPVVDSSSLYCIAVPELTSKAYRRYTRDYLLQEIALDEPDKIQPLADYHHAGQLITGLFYF
jgi:hypothetical protein